MKRNLQEKQWAEKLKTWEESTSSQTWDRPSEGGWDRIAESLPPTEKKPFLAWWKTALLMLALIGFGSVYYVYFYQNKDSNTIADISNNSPDINPIEKNTFPSNKINIAENLALLKGQIDYKKSNPEKEELSLLNSNKSNTFSKSILSTKHYPKEGQNEQVISSTEQVNLIRNDSIKTQKIESIPQVFIETIDNETIEIQMPSPNVIASEIDTPEADITHEFSPEQLANSPQELIISSKSQYIPTLAFSVEAKEDDLKMQPSLDHQITPSLWSVDAYAQHSLQAAFRPVSPIWRLRNEKSQSYGLQLNRMLGKGFSVHIGLQKRSEQYKINGAFLRMFNRDNEDSMGRSTFRLSTSISDEKNIEEDVVVERNAGQIIPLGTSLRFRVEREVAVDMISVPIGLNYAFWQSYPFQLSAVFGGEYTRIKIQTERKSLTLQNPGLNIRQVNLHNNNQTFAEKDFSLQAGVRLDVHITPKIKTMVQVDFQGATQNGRGLLFKSGNQVRFGLSYNL